MRCIYCGFVLYYFVWFGYCYLFVYRDVLLVYFVFISCCSFIRFCRFWFLILWLWLLVVFYVCFSSLWFDSVGISVPLLYYSVFGGFCDLSVWCLRWRLLVVLLYLVVLTCEFALFDVCLIVLFGCIIWVYGLDVVVSVLNLVFWCYLFCGGLLRLLVCYLWCWLFCLGLGFACGCFVMAFGFWLIVCVCFRWLECCVWIGVGVGHLCLLRICFWFGFGWIVWLTLFL